VPSFFPVAEIVSAGLRGRVVEVVGTENLTLNELATRVARAAGRYRLATCRRPC